MIGPLAQLSEQNFVYTEQQEKVRQEFFEVTDMVVLILSNLSGKDLEACLRVKKKFYAVIMQSKSLRSFLFFERATAKAKLIGEKAYPVGIKIACLRAIKNITRTPEYVSDLPEAVSDLAWLKIISKTMTINLEKTKSIIKQIESPESPETRHTAWSKVLKIEKVSENVDELKKSLRQLDYDPHPRYWIELYGYTKKEKYLTKTLPKIERNLSADYQFECWLELYKATESIKYLQKAKDCLQMISDDTELSWDYLELSKIEDKEENLKKAKEAAGKITSPERQFIGWLKICEENLTEEHLKSAKACISKIEYSQMKRDAWLKIVKLEAKINPQAAKETAQNVGHDETTSECLQKIVKQEIEQNLENAKITTTQIKDDFYRAKAWIEIFKKESSYENLQKILACIRNISELSQRALLWTKLARIGVGF